MSRILALAALMITGPVVLGLVGSVSAQDASDAEAFLSGAGEGLNTQTAADFLGEAPDQGEGLEAAISGSEYRLGPGDVLVISIWGPQPIAYRLGVTLEGNLLIPSVGELEVNNLLLSEAKDVIRRTVLKNFRNVDVTVTLVKLRRFQIHVLGQVQSPGTYVATAVQRVSYAVAMARGFSDRANRRHLLVENGDTLRTEADLYSFHQRGIVTGNPTLRDGDKIYVPYSDETVEIRGAVNFQGRIDFLKGDRLSDILILAGGLTEKSFTDTIEVARFARGTSTPARLFVVAGGGVSASSIFGAQSVPEVLGTFVPAGRDTLDQMVVYPDFKLQPDDRIFVRSVPEYRLRRLVEINGEVLYPGVYPFQEGKSRISDLIAWSGGLTKDANLLEAKLLRETVGQTDREFERLKLVSVSDMDEEEYAFFKVKSREVKGKMVVDFAKALAGDPSEDLILHRGDRLVIPPQKDFVSVLGLVSNPGNVTYRPGLKAKHYVELAGGFSADADRGNSRVVKPEGGEWQSFGDAGVLGKGDAVFVPEKKKGRFWSTLRSALTISTQVLTIYLVVDRAITN